MNVIGEITKGFFLVARAPMELGIGVTTTVVAKVAEVSVPIFEAVADYTNYDTSLEDFIDDPWENISKTKKIVPTVSAIGIGLYSTGKGFRLWKNSGGKSGGASGRRAQQFNLKNRKDWWKGMGLMIFGVGALVGSYYSLTSD